MAPFHAYDRGMSPGEALRASWDAAIGHKGAFFVRGLAQMGLLLLGMLACCMGGLVTQRVVLLARTIIFMRPAGLAQGTLADVTRAPACAGRVARVEG